MNPRVHVMAVLRAVAGPMKIASLKNEVENRVGRLLGYAEWSDLVSGMVGKGQVLKGVDDDDDETLRIPEGGRA